LRRGFGSPSAASSDAAGSFNGRSVKGVGSGAW
jgi:hypothetical protein